MFYDGFHDVVTADDYSKIFLEDITNGVISSNSVDYLSGNIYSPLATSHSTASKTLTISSSCSTNCLISIVAIWKKSPVVRSYDLMGAYLSNVSLVGDITTIARNSTGTNYSSGTVQSVNGFGESVLLLSSGSDMKITQYFYVTPGGMVYGSYQHAKSSISLANSMKYSISLSGYGNVFLFNNTSISNHYDGMGGVNINV